MTSHPAPGVMLHFASLNDSISPHDQDPITTPHTPSKRLALAVLMTVFEDCRDGATAAQITIDQRQPGRSFVPKEARAWFASVAWLNGGEALMSFDVACALIECEPQRLRNRVAERIGLEQNSAGEIVGPYTLEHVRRARSIVDATRCAGGANRKIYANEEDLD